MIARLLGLPEEDLPTFRRRAIQLISYAVDYQTAFEASAALKDYFLGQIEQRKSKPTDDIIGDLVTADIDGEKPVRRSDLLLPATAAACRAGTTYRLGNLLSSR